jgi:hypothetical protein
MKRSLILIVGAMLLMAASCKKEAVNRGEVYRDGDFSIQFTDFTDSRCPQDAECIWAGEAVVFLKAASGETNIDFSLRGLGSDTTLMGYKIEFVDLLPYPETGVEQTLEDKELTLNVIKL